MFCSENFDEESGVEQKNSFSMSGRVLVPSFYWYGTVCIYLFYSKYGIFNKMEQLHGGVRGESM